MIIEHQFITKRPADEAMDRAEEFLGRIGFYRASKAVISRGRHDSCREYERRPWVLAIEDVSQLPQHIIIEFDRGRMTVAGLIALSPKWGGRSAYAFWVSDDRLFEKASEPKRLMSSLVRELESVVANEPSDEFDTSLEDAVLAHTKTESKFRSIGAGSSLFAFVALAVVLMIVLIVLIRAIYHGFYSLFH